MIIVVTGAVGIGHPEETLTEEKLEAAYNIKCRIINLDDNINRKLCIPLKSKPINIDLMLLFSLRTARHTAKTLK